MKIKLGITETHQRLKLLSHQLSMLEIRNRHLGAYRDGDTYARGEGLQDAIRSLMWDMLGHVRLQTKQTISLFPKLERSRPSLLVVVHIHYEDLLDELLSFVDKVADCDIDVDVAVTSSDSLVLDKVLLRSNRSWRLETLLVENRGRDIWPFLRVLQHVDTGDYQAILKVHSKRSPHQGESSGNKWRRALLTGLLPRGVSAVDVLRAFRDDASLGLVIAEGSRRGFEEVGSNLPGILRLCSQVNLLPSFENISFPAGSMFWMRPWLARILQDLDLAEDDFEREPIGVDGSLAHSFERFIGLICVEAGLEMLSPNELERKIVGKRKKGICVGAFWQPHPFSKPVRDKRTGKRHADLVAVNNAYKLLPQQVLLGPLSGASYDLNSIDGLYTTVGYMEKFGLDFITSYFFWFDEEQIPGTPLDLLLKNPDINLPFALCWVNEPRTEVLDGADHNVLPDIKLKQGWATRLADDIAKYLMDSRYMKIDNRPLLLIHRPDKIEASATMLNELRNSLVDRLSLNPYFLGGLPPHVPEAAAIRAIEWNSSLDAYYRFPPREGAINLSERTSFLPMNSAMFQGKVWSYSDAAGKPMVSEMRSQLGQPIYQGVMTGWDNTPRNDRQSSLFVGSNPIHFRAWLARAAQAEVENHTQPMIFINALNDWGEGAVLEPATPFGDLFGLTVRDVMK